MRRLAAALTAALTAILLWCPLASAGEASWQLEQPVQPGSLFATALGAPGDLQFLAPNRGLLAVEGNAAIPPGLFVYDGLGWHQLSVVCGGDARHARVAWAGPREFWVVTRPSQPRAGDGTSLCHFKDGEVVASYSTPDQSPDPYREMTAAACNGPNDCWFGGPFAQDATGERVGAFHLHWDGSQLTTVYAPQGRGVTDLESHAGTIHESVMVGRRLGEGIDADELTESEPDGPRLLHRIVAGAIVNDTFTVAAQEGLPSDGSELLTLDGNGTQLWAAGGGAASGPTVEARGPGSVVSRPPLVARLEAGSWQELPLGPAPFLADDRFVDIAAVPGSETAWAAVEPFSQRASTSAVARVAHVAADGAVELTSLPASGPGRGQAARIAFTGPNDGWLVTNAGWIFHYTDGTRPPRDTDSAFQGTITFRPNEAAEQFVPDRPPVDDSDLFKPPPLSLDQASPAVRTHRLAPLLRKVKTVRRGTRLIVRFTLVRKARVSLTARRNGKVVGRTKPRLMRPGRHVLSLRLTRKRWPQRLSFSAREPGAAGEGGDDNDTITTGMASR